MGRIILVTGGARSGKSSFAERYAAKTADDRAIAYIATARVEDEEMRARVKLHRERRPDTWDTFEAPVKAEEAIIEAGWANKIILFDCITLYLSNYLLSLKSENLDKDTLGATVKEYIGKLIEAAASLPETTTIFVSNEVGAGIVPENKLARLYRDMAGLANQEIARAADSVYLVVSGMAIDLKKIAEVI